MRFRLLALAVLLLPLEARAGLALPRGLHLTLTEAAVYAALAACALSALRRPRPFDALDWAAVAWSAAWVAAGLGAPWGYEDAVKAAARLAAGGLLFVFARASAAPGESDRLGRTLAVAGAVAAVAGLLDIATPALATPLFAAFRAKVTTSAFGVRATGTFEHANQLSAFLELALPFGLLWLAAPGAARRGAATAGLLAGVACLMWAMSRAGWAAGGAGLALALFLARRRLPRPGRVALLAGTVPLVLLATSPRLRGRLLWPAVRPPFAAAYAYKATPSPRIVVTNTGSVRWAATGPDRVRLSVFGRRLTPPPKEAEAFLDLPHDAGPDETVEVPIDPAGTLPPGRYLHVYEVVHPSYGYGTQWDLPPLSGETIVTRGHATLRYGGDGGPLRPPFATRPQLWAAAWRAFRERPSFGWGPGMFQRFSTAWLAGVQHDPRLHPNELYLHHLAEGGLPAFLALLAVGIAAARRLAPRWRGRGTSLGACAGAGALLAWFLHGFADSFILFNGTGWAFWVALAAACPADERGQPRRRS